MFKDFWIHICFLSHKLISKILIRYGKRILIQIVLVHRFGDFSIIFLLISWRNNFFIILRIIFLHFSVTCNFLVLQPFYLQPMIFHLFCLYLLSSTILFQDLFLSCLLLSHFITFPSPFRLLSYRRWMTVGPLDIQSQFHLISPLVLLPYSSAVPNCQVFILENCWTGQNILGHDYKRKRGELRSTDLWIPFPYLLYY